MEKESAMRVEIQLGEGRSVRRDNDPNKEITTKLRERKREGRKSFSIISKTYILNIFYELISFRFSFVYYYKFPLRASIFLPTSPFTTESDG